MSFALWVCVRVCIFNVVQFHCFTYKWPIECDVYGVQPVCGVHRSPINTLTSQHKPKPARRIQHTAPRWQSITVKCHTLFSELQVCLIISQPHHHPYLPHSLSLSPLSLSLSLSLFLSLFLSLSHSIFIYIYIYIYKSQTIYQVSFHVRYLSPFSLWAFFEKGFWLLKNRELRTKGADSITSERRTNHVTEWFSKWLRFFDNSPVSTQCTALSVTLGPCLKWTHANALCLHIQWYVNHLSESCRSFVTLQDKRNACDYMGRLTGLTHANTHTQL